MTSQAEVSEVLSEALALTEGVPEGMRRAAFEKVFDLLAARVVGVGSSDAHVIDFGASGPNLEPREKPRDRRTGSSARAKEGPKHAVDSLIDSGYFDEARTLDDLAIHLKHECALVFERRHLATALAREVRDGRLRRVKNSEGKYEYQRCR